MIFLTSYIAQTPLEQRDQSRLLILDRQSGEIQHAVFKDIGELSQSWRYPGGQ